MSFYKFKDKNSQIVEFGVDHSDFTVWDELKYNIMRKKESMRKQQNPIKQVFGAVGDMVGHYFDMKRDNTISADDYFHCKANYDAAKRGAFGKYVSQWLGDTKEDFDYLKNQFSGMSPLASSFDRIHDKKVNEIGRQRARSSLYSNSREACQSFRVDGINKKY